VAASAGMAPEDLPGAVPSGEEQPTVETPTPEQAPQPIGGDSDAAAT
jgi:hypothetical protein